MNLIDRFINLFAPPPTSYKYCNKCGGVGWVFGFESEEEVKDDTRVICPKCNGEGFVL